MIEIIKEEYECVQGNGRFECYIIVLNGHRIFSTEDIDYLINSPTLFTENDLTLVLTWDRNSLELPELGPNLDIDIQGDLYVHRVDGWIQLECSNDADRKVIGKCSLSDWITASKKL